MLLDATSSLNFGLFLYTKSNLPLLGISKTADGQEDLTKS